MSISTASRLRPRTEPELAGWLARSAATTQGAQLSTDEVLSWLADRTQAHDFRVDPIPFADLDGWFFDEASGNLGHHSGRFFTVEGLQVTVADASGVTAPRRWCQPILNQPEIGILGLLVKEFDGVAHVLIQAKMEPGNRNLLQLSPTVQATWSNYTGVHRGAAVRYLEYFTGPADGRVLADVLQSEQGSWFYRKVNRNMIVEVSGEVPPHEDFRWLTLGQIGQLLHHDNVVSMDARSTLSCLPLDRGERGALHSDAEVLSWFTGVRSRYTVRADRIPLADVSGWTRTESAIGHEHGRHFRIVGVSVHAGSREITSWSQPLLEPSGLGVVCFLACQIDGVRHVLARGYVEGGLVASVELGPTVQCVPDDCAHLPEAQRPPFLDRVLSAAPSRILYSAIQSEEGGRFLNAENRYLVIDVGEPFEPPPDYLWVTHGQLNTLVRHGHYLNVEARTLLTALNAIAVTA
ncbi:NDP-hexose 2,3-dehydratase family protein [Streptosporangium sp. NPDC001559]|uniref:NDP-hexose 2,3-dehydratase family protein n=1 Tax=Streptosporangium sp. NPDC001559 TaxID=3366187 RepID=UPI0036ED2B11